MKNFLSNAPLDCFQVHPEVSKTYREKNLDGLCFTIEKYGQQTPVKVIEQEGQMYIIDGVSRFVCAKQLGLPSLIYVIVEVDDNKIIEYRMLSNVKTKRKFTEMCLEAEYVLGTLGKSQGKKRKILGLDQMDIDKTLDKASKNRFELACALMGLDMKGQTLRNGMAVFLKEFNPNGKSESGIIEKLDQNLISINNAYNMVIKKDKSVSHKEKKDMAILNIAELNLISQDSPYQLYNKSSLFMNEVENNSVRLCLNSHPYMKLRKYRNQDSLRHGRESSREKYIANFRLFNAEVFKKLLPGGVLVTIIGETYKGGYKGICSHAELALEEIGYKIIDVVIWVKNNQQYAPHPFRFQNSYERIIVAVKPGAKPIFNEVLRKGSVEKFKVKKTSNDSFYLARPETCITNVITSDTHNPAELRVVDPHFFHDGPAPLAIYRPFIEAYSCPGDLIMDNFVGSGTIGVGLEMGRRVIGYDVDPVSIEFCHKRFEYFLKGEPKMDLTVAA